jgi:hypothetical protein
MSQSLAKPVAFRLRLYARTSYVVTSILMFDWVSFGIDNSDVLIGHHSALLDTGMVACGILLFASCLLILVASSRSGVILGIVACAIAAVPVVYALLTVHVFVRYFSDQDLHRYAIVASAIALAGSLVVSIRALRSP